jgi:hypothetical protein
VQDKKALAVMIAFGNLSRYERDRIDEAERNGTIPLIVGEIVTPEGRERVRRLLTKGGAA